MQRLSDILTVWTTTRAAGMTSYYLLYASTIAGLLMSAKLSGKKAKATVLAVHQWAGWFGFLFGFVHGMVLLFDRYVGYSFYELAVPFAAHDHRILNGIGTLTFYVTAILILSSDLMGKLGKRVWRAIHFLAFAGFGMALVHGLLLGTDSQLAWVKATYAVTALSVALLTAWRIYSARRRTAEGAVRIAAEAPARMPLAREHRMLRNR